jgi:hypothetical protein
MFLKIVVCRCFYSTPMIGSFIAYLRLQAMEDGILIQMSVGIATCIDSTIQNKSMWQTLVLSTAFPKKKSWSTWCVSENSSVCNIFLTELFFTKSILKKRKWD